MEYLYKNRHRPVSNNEIGLGLGNAYTELNYLRDKGEVEFEYVPGTSELIFDVRITAEGVDEIEGKKSAVAERPTTDRQEIGEPYVFISHSSKDTTIISAVKTAFVDLPLKPHFVEEKPTGVPPSREIAQAVRNAEALFVFFTSNSVLGETRDWIVFEMGVAIGHGRDIYSWKYRDLIKQQLPRLLEQVSTYREFEISGDGTIRLVADIRAAAKRLKQS